ncbi:MAG: PAS domain S-box protein [Methanomicrobiales archaeon]|nr:PAS domain S-box protein [Methanomicrobiales archaeon]
MATEKFRDEQMLIKELLAKHPDGMSIRQVSEMLGINRNSVAKYLDMLQMQGRVTVRRLGAAKIYSLGNRLPADAVFRLARSGVIQFNHMLIVIGLNATAEESLRVSRDEILGKKIRDLPFTLECNPDIHHLLLNGLKGNERRTDARIIAGDRTFAGKVTVSPVFFENGSPGVSLVIDPESGGEQGAVPAKEQDLSEPELNEIEYICVFDPHGILILVNAAYCRMMQKSKTDLIGQKWHLVIADSDCKKIKKSIASLTIDRPQIIEEFRVVTKSGESRWQRWTFTGYFTDAGEARKYRATGLDITGWKKNEERLLAKHHESEKRVHESEAEIRELNKQLYNEISNREKADFHLQFTQFAMDNASYLIIWIDREGRFIYMNKRAYEYIGYSYRELLTRNLFEFLPESLKMHWDSIWDTIRAGRHSTRESVLITRRGEVPVELVLNFLEFKEKSYCCCFIADISERRDAERTLKERQEQYRFLFEGAAEGIIAVDIQTRTIQQANPAMCRMLGYSEEELLTRSIETIHPASDLPFIFTEFDAMARGEKKMVPAVPCLRKDGTLIYTDIISSTLVINGATCNVGFFIDVTDRRNAEMALERSRKELASIFNHLPDATFVINRDGRVIAWNRAIEAMTGVKAKEMLGKGDHEYAIPFYGERRRILADLVFHPEDDNGIGNYLMLQKEGDLFIAENTLPGIHGGNGVLWAKATPVYDEHGEKIAAIESIRDITERKNTEDALRESEERYRSLIENLPQRIFFKDVNSVYISCNNNYAADLKIFPEEIAGMTDYDFYPRELADKYREDDQRLIHSGRSEEIVEEYLVDTTMKRVKTIKTPVRDARGNPLGIIGIFWEIP